MLRFAYRAYRPSGEVDIGEVEAASEGEAVAALRNQGLLPADVRPAQSASAVRWWNREIWSPRSLRSAGLASFARELATLVAAEVPLEQALLLVSEEEGNSATGLFAKRVLEEVRRGQSLSDALASVDAKLPRYCVGMVRAGEAAGNLKATLPDIARLLERQQELSSRIGAMLVYPALLAGLSIVAIVVVVVVLIPTIAPLIEGAGRELPTVLALLLGLQRILASNWPILLIALLLGLMGVIVGLSNDKSRLLLDRAVLRLPVLGTIIAKLHTARFARTLASLLRSGVPLVQALGFARGVTANRHVKAAVETAIEDLRHGQSLRDSLRRSAAFPRLAIRLVAVGEEAGRLDQMLSHVADVFETQAQRSIDRMMSLVTPVITVVLGFAIGGLLLSVMKAILSVNDIALQ
jgi:general secretion pathway protein F